MINRIQVAKSELGISDIRKLGSSDGGSLFLDGLEHFLVKASEFDNSHGGNNKGFLKLFVKNRDKLLASLELEWNVKLNRDNRGYIFAKSTPKKTEKPTLNCDVETCEKSFTNPTSLQRHLKSAHSIVRNVAKKRVTCRLCCTSILEDQIARHLRDVHKKTKPDEESLFRGFESWDTGRTWSVVWRKDGEPDPQGPRKENVITQKRDDLDDGKKEKDDTATHVGEPSKLRIDSNLVDEVCDDVDYNQISNLDIVENVFDEDPQHLVEHASQHEDEETLKEIRELDGDVEKDDPEEFTMIRLNNKLARFKKRNDLPENDPCSLDGNRDFIEDFSRFVKKGATSTNPNLSTISNMTGHLFRWKTSWLRFEIKKDPSFRLSRLVMFSDRDQLVQLQNPTKWTETVAGEDGKQNPIDRKQMFKAHRKLQEYVLEKLNDHEEGNELLDMVWKEKLIDKIKKIKEDVDRSGVWGFLNNLIGTNKRKQDAAREVVNPNKSMKGANSNQVYFTSEKFKIRAERMEKIYQDAIEKEKAGSKKKIGVKNYNEYGNYARHILGRSTLFSLNY